MHSYVDFFPSAAIGADGYFRRPLRPAVCPSVCPSILTGSEGRRYRSNSLRISGISLTFGGMMHRISPLSINDIFNDHFACFSNQAYEHSTRDQLWESREYIPEWRNRRFPARARWIAETSGPRLNIKTVLSTYGDFHVKDKTAVRTSYL